MVKPNSTATLRPEDFPCKETLINLNKFNYLRKLQTTTFLMKKYVVESKVLVLIQQNGHRPLLRYRPPEFDHSYWKFGNLTQIFIPPTFHKYLQSFAFGNCYASTIYQSMFDHGSLQKFLYTFN